MLYSSGGRPATALSPMFGITLSSYIHTSMPSRCTFLGANSIHFSGRCPSKRSGGSTTWSSTLTRIRSSARMGSPLSTEDHRQRRRGPERHAGDVRRGGGGGEAEGGGAGGDALPHPPPLHACPVHAPAHVRAEREREVLARLAVDIELLRALPVRLVVVRRAHVGDDDRAGGDLDALDDRVTRRGAHDRRERGLPAQALLDRLRQQ